MEFSHQLLMTAENPNVEDIEALIFETSKLNLEEIVSEGRDIPNNQVVTYHKSVENGKYVPVLLSLGFRFQPDDFEIMEYLNKKINEGAASCSFIPSINIYEYSPDELAVMHPSLGVDEWYYFSTRDRKYVNGKRPNRAAGGKGYWKAIGRNIELHHNGVHIGSKRSLVFHEGMPPAGRKTEWSMIEFVSCQSQRERTGPSDMRLDDCVMCRIHKNSSEIEEASEQSCETKKQQRKHKRVKIEHNSTSHSSSLPSDLGASAHSFISNQHHSVSDGQPSLQNLPQLYFTLEELGLQAPQQQPSLRAQAWQQHHLGQQQSLQNLQQYLLGQPPNPSEYLPKEQPILHIPQQQLTLQVPQQHVLGQQSNFQNPQQHNPWQQPNLQNPQPSLLEQQQISQMMQQEQRLQVPQQHYPWEQPNLQNPQQYLPELQPSLQMPQQPPRTQMLQPNLPQQHSNFPTSVPVGQHHIDSMQYSHQAGSQDLGGMLDCPPERISEEFVRQCLHHIGNDSDLDFIEMVNRLLQHEANDFNTMGGFNPDSLLNDDDQPQHVSDIEIPHTTRVTGDSQLAVCAKDHNFHDTSEPRQD